MEWLGKATLALIAINLVTVGALTVLALLWGFAPPWEWSETMREAMTALPVVVWLVVVCASEIRGSDN